MYLLCVEIVIKLLKLIQHATAHKSQQQPGSVKVYAQLSFYEGLIEMAAILPLESN